MTVDTLQDALKAEETLVFAHRGASASAPQNTLAAFELAAQQNAHGIELDVHLTRDGHLAVIHDETVDATTDGGGAVAQMSLAQLKELDAGVWFSPEFADQRIPTLDEVFAAVGHSLFVNVEIKSSAAGIENAVADCIRRKQMQSRVLVSSFDPDVLRRLRPLINVPLGFLCLAIDDAQNNLRNYEALHLWHEYVDDETMRRAREAGCLVNVWTVNDPVRACQLAALGVDCLITDQPAAMLAALRQC